MTPIVFTPQDPAEAYGRNGRFHLSSIELWRDFRDLIVFDAYSQRRGDSPPFCIKITRPMLEALAKAIDSARASGQFVSATVTPKTGVARGRNNWFDIANFQVHAPSPKGNSVDVYSFRTGNQAPASLYLSAADLDRLITMARSL